MCNSYTFSIFWSFAKKTSVMQSFELRVGETFVSNLCHGMTESVKVHRKDQSVKDFTSKCLFLLFWLISCISLIFLTEI